MSIIRSILNSARALVNNTLPTTGSNTFIGTQTMSGSIIPAVDNTYDLGSATYQWRDIYVSSGSLYIDGTKVLGSTNQELQITTDEGQSIKILEAGSDNIILQSSDGDIQLKSSGGGNLLFDPTTGLIDIRGTLQIQDGQKITSSGGNSVVIGDDLVVTGSINITGNVNGINLTTLNTTANKSATTGSNIFNGNQIITGSMYMTGDLVVYGTSSLQNITASATTLGTNTIILNSASPAFRFAGISVIDSGSSQATGSLFWDSVNNHWIYQKESGAVYGGGMLISGPRNLGALGDEVGMTNNTLTMGIGGDHISSSAIYHDTTTTCFYNSTTINSSGVLTSTNLVGTICARNGVVSGSSQITGIGNSQLTNSTISGISLGSNLATLTIGTGLSGTSYNGSTGVTIANSGVTSIVAGTGISINQGTAAVTVTNTITNNNQLTNGAGYITGAGNAATATALSSGQSNWSGTGVLSNVVGLLAWKNYTNGHIIFDASNSTSPSGGSVNNANAQIAWTGTYPTLMGWNGSNTYGVRVDSSRVSDSTTGNAATVTNGVYNNASQNNLSGVFNFGSSGATPYNNPTGTSNGISFGGIESTSLRTYGIFTEQENIGGNYSKLTFNYHTGVRIGASSSYGGTRFYNNFAGGSGGGTEIFSIGNGDNNARSSADIIAYASDKRLKENITNIPNALDKIKQINGVYFDWKDKTKELGFNPSQKHDVGVIAQEIQAILPEVVTLAPFDYELGKSKSGENYLTVKYDKIVPLLIEAIKEQQTQIEELKTIINGLTK
jgi:hypothetical protein